MAITTEAVPETRFDRLADVQDWISDTAGQLDRISINGVLESGASLVDDEYLGDGDTMFRFNARGVRAFCHLIGFRFDHLNKLESPGLTTAVLNDLLKQREIRSKLAEFEFVIDNRAMTVIGIVSKSYVSYDNATFLTDILGFLDSVKNEEPCEFQEAYVVNTELTIRYCTTKRHGEIKGRGGAGADRSKLGMEFHNSMVGTSSVLVNYFLYRLACANGMMVPAGESVSRIHHAGNRDTFNRRLKHRLAELVRKLNGLSEMLADLGTMPFDPKKLVINREVNQQLFDVIPSTRRTIADGEGLSLTYPSESTTEERANIKNEHDATIVRLIPKYFAGEHSRRVFESSFRESATVFDLINVFTEYAKERPPSQRLEIEEKAGRLAKYISDNKKKF